MCSENTFRNIECRLRPQDLREIVRESSVCARQWYWRAPSVFASIDIIVWDDGHNPDAAAALYQLWSGNTTKLRALRIRVVPVSVCRDTSVWFTEFLRPILAAFKPKKEERIADYTIPHARRDNRPDTPGFF